MDLLFGGGSGGTTYIDSAARLNSVIRYRRTEDAVCQTSPVYIHGSQTPTMSSQRPSLTTASAFNHHSYVFT